MREPESYAPDRTPSGVEIIAIHLTGRTVMLGILAAVLAGCQALTGQSSVKVDFYSVTGNSIASIDRDIRRKGPRIDGRRHAVAVARIRISPLFATRIVDGRCALANVRVPVDARVTLPEWTGRKRASRALGRAWDNIDRYTRLHESVHVAIAFRYAQRMEDALKALPPAASCATVRSAAKVVTDRLLVQHDARQRQFDRDEQRRLAKLARSAKS